MIPLGGYAKCMQPNVERKKELYEHKAGLGSSIG